MTNSFVGDQFCSCQQRQIFKWWTTS